jgi:hypothetical protein
MRKYPDCTELYRRMEEGKKDYARLPIAEKLAIAARLRDVQEKLAPTRAANKAKRAHRKVNIPVRPDQD